MQNNAEHFSIQEEAPRHAPRGRKVVVVGTGHVGLAYAFALLQSGLPEEIVLVGRDEKKTRAQAMDLNHGLMFVSPALVRSGDYDDCAGADLVAVTAGAAMKPGETRIDLARKNVDIFRTLIPKIARHDPGTLLVVANPVDVLTYAAQKLSGLPAHRIMGSGTVLDTARFRYLLSTHCKVAPNNAHGYVLGEHGDSEVAAWSVVNIAGIPLRSFCPECGRGCPEGELDAIFERVRNAAYEIIDGKGHTEHAIALAMVRITAGVLRDERSVLTVSSLVEGAYGLDDVCLSVPAVIGRKGVERVLELPLEPAERKALEESAKMLRDVQEECGL